MLVQLKDKKLVYEECSHGEALGSKHIMIMYINKKAIKYFRIKEIKGILIG